MARAAGAVRAERWDGDRFLLGGAGIGADVLRVEAEAGGGVGDWQEAPGEPGSVGASGCGFSAGADRGYGPGRDGDALPKSELAKAAGYLRNHWELLQQYTCDGCCPIDNNQTEQLMKTA